MIRISAIAAAVTACAAAGALAACGSSGDGNDMKASIAFITYAETDYQQAQIKGMKKAVSDAGGGSVKTMVSHFDASNEAGLCQDAVTSGRYNAIVLSAISGATSGPCVKAAESADIPLIGLDIPLGRDQSKLEPQSPGVTGQVVIPLGPFIKLQVDATKKACAGKDPCKIIAEVSTGSDPVTNQPLDEIAKQVPNAKIVAKFETVYDPAAVVQAMPDLLAAHPDADVYFSIADSSATAAIPAIKEAGMTDQLKVIGNGGSVLGAKAIKDGNMFLTTALFPVSAGEAAGKMAVQGIRGEKIDPVGIDASKLDSPLLVTKANVDQLTPQWGATTQVGG